jgi:DNA-binding transcriptional LysR family regulator
MPTMDAKVAAQVAGLGCGNLPVHIARPFLDAGLLVPKLLAESRMSGTIYCSWTTASRGKALQWFVQRLDDPAVRQALVG